MIREITNRLRLSSIRAVFVFFLHGLLLWTCAGEIRGGRIRGDDEPQLVNWRVLEGITEPFQNGPDSSIPVWKQMKMYADQKAAHQAIPQALHEYGQLLRHPYLFGEMPAKEKYDVFLSMARLLTTMGFQQRAELLLYEAMSYVKDPYEAHLQLGLLALDREDLDKAKLHFKNCLYHQDDDLVILVYLSLTLVVEHKLHEAQFFLARIVAQLQSKVNKLSFLLSAQERKTLDAHMAHGRIVFWLEETLIKVFRGEFRVTPSATVDLYRHFSNLHRWLSDAVLTERVIFDLGAALYEAGRSQTALRMMQRGRDTALLALEDKMKGDAATTSSSVEPDEGDYISLALMSLRLALETPLVPTSLADSILAYLHTTHFLASSSSSTPLEGSKPMLSLLSVDHLLDLAWPLTALTGPTGLRMAPVVRELLWRFDYGLNATGFRSDASGIGERWAHHLLSAPPSTLPTAPPLSWDENRSEVEGEDDCLESEDLDDSFISANNNDDTEGEDEEEVEVIEVGILGGHFNDHPVGLDVLARLLQPLQKYTRQSHSMSLLKPRSKQRRRTCRSRSTSAPQKQWSVGAKRQKPRRWRLSITLLLLPHTRDSMTSELIALVQRTLHLPPTVLAAQRSILTSLTPPLHVLLLPDAQAFPDAAQSLGLAQTRLAPLQVCVALQGLSCGGAQVDYLLLSSEQEALLAVSSGGSGQGHGGGWQEVFAEQVVVVQHWPIFTAQGMQTQLRLLQTQQQSSASPSAVSSASGTNPRSGEDEDVFVPSNLEGSLFFAGQSTALLVLSSPQQLHPVMDETLLKILRALPTLHLVIALSEHFLYTDAATGTSNNHHHEENSHHHKDEYQDNHAHSAMLWGQRLVRRLWAAAGAGGHTNGFGGYDDPSSFSGAQTHAGSNGGTSGGGASSSVQQRIRLLPRPVTQRRLLQLLRQSDLLLDCFPHGVSLHTLQLAVSVGTPVLTLRTGTMVSTPQNQLQDLRHRLVSATFSSATSSTQGQSQVASISLRSHPVAAYLALHDVPYHPAVSTLAALYHTLDNAFFQHNQQNTTVSSTSSAGSKRVWLERTLVASSAAQYAQLACRLLGDREFSYAVRIQLLAALDLVLFATPPRQSPRDTTRTTMSKETVARKRTENLDVDASTGVVPNERERRLEDNEEEEEEEEGLDLARTLVNLGREGHQRYQDFLLTQGQQAQRKGTKKSADASKDVNRKTSTKKTHQKLGLDLDLESGRIVSSSTASTSSSSSSSSSSSASSASTATASDSWTTTFLVHFLGGNPLTDQKKQGG